MEDRLLRLKEVLEVIPVSRATGIEASGRDSILSRKNMAALPSGGCPPCKKSSQGIKKISPRLHHLRRSVMYSARLYAERDLVFINVCELAFDNIRAPAHFVEQGGCHAAESMRGHLPGKPH